MFVWAVALVIEFGLFNKLTMSPDVPGAANCRSCGTDLRNEKDAVRCTRCGANLPMALRRELARLAGPQAPPATPPTRA